MSCPKTELISAYLDGEIGFGEKAKLETHLHGCPSCSHRLEELRSLSAAFLTAERNQAPYGFAARVMARTAELKSPSGVRMTVRGWFVPVAVRFAEAAVLLVVITVGILAGRVMTSSSPAEMTANLASSLSLDVFAPAPQGSLGNVYLAMTEVKREK